MRQVSSGYVNFVASGVHLTPCRLQHSSTLSCRPVLTTATRFSPGRRRLLQTDCNECWTLRHVLSATPEIWSWPVADYAYRASLAGRSWTNQLQTRYAHVPMPAQQSSPVPDGPLHISIRRCLSSTAKFCFASSHEVSVPRHRLSTYGRRAFAVADPTVWNSLPEDMRDPDVSEDSYRQSLKTFLFSQY